ncbi:MAG: T9SS type A sorting domain-containing protein, partial [Candidatus Latescibacterota bacterium]
RFERLSECAISGAFSLRCGLEASDAATRNWPGGAGYGNYWRESVEREFEFDGTTPVWFAFDYRCDLEPEGDVGQACIEVDGVETVITDLTGNGAGATNIDLTPYLTAGPAPSSYTLRFCVVSDFAWSDEDGKHDTQCGALVIDNLTVTGGGVSYATGFEASTDGWHQDDRNNPATEYWLVENRQPVGFDTNLPGSGLLIWHVDEEVLRSALGNSGGSSGNTVRGLVLEEADGLGHLLQDPGTTGNEGDDGDPWPGSTGNTAFDTSTSPNSSDNSQYPTNIVVSGIGPSGQTMSAFLRAGDPGPATVSVSPGVINNDLTTVSMEITGSGFRHGAMFRFVKNGEPDLEPSTVRWRDDQTLFGEVYVYSRGGGAWDLIVENPDGQRSILHGAITIVELVAAQLVSAMIRVVDGDVELVFELLETHQDETLVVSRSGSETGPWIEMSKAPVALDDHRFRFVDDTVEPGHSYHYRLEVQSNGGSVRELYRGSAVIPEVEFVLEQNHPNPFNPTTSIRFHLPQRADMVLEVFDITGARVAVVAEGRLPAGLYTRIWNGRDGSGVPVGSGVYIYRLRAGNRVESRKMILLK